MKVKTIIFINLIVLLSVVSVLLLYNLRGNNKKNLSEIDIYISKIKLEYQSPRGFGNDRFDIYSFSIKDDEVREIDFKLSDNELDKIYRKEFQNILYAKGKNNQQLLELGRKIENLKQKNSFIYKYIRIKGTKKLYLYEKDLNEGYCLILTI